MLEALFNLQMMFGMFLPVLKAPLIKAGPHRSCRFLQQGEWTLGKSSCCVSLRRKLRVNVLGKTDILCKISPPPEIPLLLLKNGLVPKFEG